jgi:protein TonB
MNLKKHIRPIVFLSVGLLHLAAILFLKIALPADIMAAGDKDAEVIKLVDIEEYQPAAQKIIMPEDTIIVPTQPTSAETIIEVEQKVEEQHNAPEIASFLDEPDYLPQHKISDVPVIPTDKILSKIEYPALALRQGIEAVVYLELYIDAKGRIRRIDVLKDPGYGFAEAAVAALEGLTCLPARANGSAVAVRYRYPIRFTLE